LITDSGIDLGRSPAENVSQDAASRSRIIEGVR
jgi:hypothetical protein